MNQYVPEPDHRVVVDESTGTPYRRIFHTLWDLKGDKALSISIRQIPGVDGMLFHGRYAVLVGIGGAFQWDTIQPRVIEVLLGLYGSEESSNV